MQRHLPQVAFRISVLGHFLSHSLHHDSSWRQGRLWTVFHSPSSSAAGFTLFCDFSLPFFLVSYFVLSPNYTPGTVLALSHSELLFAAHNDLLKCCHVNLICDEETEARIVSGGAWTGTGKASWCAVKSRSGARLSGLESGLHCSPAG